MDKQAQVDLLKEIKDRRVEDYNRKTLIAFNEDIASYDKMIADVAIEMAAELAK